LLAWCEGEIESVSNIKVNGNPIENYYSANSADPYGQGAEVTTKLGKINQTSIQGFGELHNISVIGSVLQKNIPVIFSGVTATAKAFKLEFEIDKLYKKEIDSQNIFSWAMTIQVEIKKIGESNYTTLGSIEILKKSTSGFKRYFKTEYLDEGIYDIRVTKITDDADVGSGALTFGDVTLSSIDEISTEDLEYPTVALTGMRLLALENLQGNLPNVTALVTGKKVRIPKVTFDSGGTDVADWEEYYYDPIASRFKRLANDAVLYWDGVTYIEAWSANPFWCLRDIILAKRYGLGDYVASDRIHEQSFLTSALYADEAVLNEQGKKEKRFRLDLAIDSQLRAPDAIAIITKSCRAIVFQSENLVKVSVERAEQTRALFTIGNIIAGSFQLKYLTNRVPNVLVVDFINKDKNYLRDRVELADPTQALPDVSPISETMQMAGVTRLTQLMRESRVLLNKLKNNRRQISFSAFFDSVLLQPNDIISFQHDLPAWGDGGRIDIYNSNTVVNLDKSIILEPNAVYELQIRNPLTDIPESRIVTNIPGVYQSLTVSVPFSFVPQQNDLWALGIQDIDIQKYRINRIGKDESGVVSISAIEYNEAVYDESAIIIPKDIYKHTSLDIPNVQNLELQEIHNKLENGQVETKIQVSFRIPPKSSKYLKQPKTFEVWVSDNDGASWNYALNTDKEFYVIPDLVTKGINYRVAIVSVLDSGEKNPIATSPQQTIQIVGIDLPPGIVTNFSFKFTDEIEFAWDKNPEPDVAGYEIRTNDDGWLSEGVGLIWRGQATKFILVRPGARSGVQYFIRAFNTAGLISSNSTLIVPTNPKPTAPLPVFTNLFEKAFITWAAVPDNDIQHYEIWQNDEPTFFGIEQAQELIVAKVSSTQFVAPVPYATTYYRVVAVDRFGRGDFSYVMEIPLLLLSGGSIAPNSITATEIRDDSITSPKLTAGSVTAGKLSVGSVVAQNIAVENLGAISANLGRIVSGEIVGALIKTSPDPYRVELDSVGLRAYDNLGRQTVALERGKLCLIDPANPDNYSYMDSGGLVLHTKYGDNPYATRITSGVALTGTTVCLPQWKGQPDILLGIKKLKSYSAASKESDQEWCVYTDGLKSYDFGGANFGWCFDVHAQLRLPGGTRAESVYNSTFGIIKTTGINTCSAIVVAIVQVWCHQNAPDPICYACLCYSILYRKQGDVTWCTKSQTFLTPHNTCSEIKQTYSLISTVPFGASGTFEVQIVETARQYIVSPFVTGTPVCQSVVCYQTVDCSHCYTIFCNSGGGGSVSTSLNSSNQAMRCTATPYVGFNSLPGMISSNIVYSFIVSLSARAGYGTSASASANVNGANYSRAYNPYQPWQAQFQGSGSVGGLQVPITLTAEARSIYTYQYEGASASVSVDMNITYLMCCTDVRQCSYRVCETVWIGGACNSNITGFKSMCEITSSNTILDPAGEVNYLAVAYR